MEYVFVVPLLKEVTHALPSKLALRVDDQQKSTSPVKSAALESVPPVVRFSSTSVSSSFLRGSLQTVPAWPRLRFWQ
jgi:hypothetical protein